MFYLEKFAINLLNVTFTGHVPGVLGFLGISHPMALADTGSPKRLNPTEAEIKLKRNKLVNEVILLVIY